MNDKKKYVNLANYDVRMKVAIIADSENPNRKFLNYLLDLDGYKIRLKPLNYSENDLIYFENYVEKHKGVK